jgi:hypothetical protein
MHVFKTFRRINKGYRPSKINSIGIKSNWASGSVLILEGVYTIPIKCNGKRIIQEIQAYRNMVQPTVLGIDGIYNLGITFLTVTK